MSSWMSSPLFCIADPGYSMASGEATTLRRRTVLEIECQDSTTLARTGKQCSRAMVMAKVIMVELRASLSEPDATHTQ